MFRHFTAHILCGVTLILSVIMVAPRTAHAVSASEINTAAKEALAKLYTQIPAAKEYGAKAKGMLVFPRVTKAGLIIGGTTGDGVLMVGGQPVDYYTRASGSIGLQAGYEEHSEVIMFTTDEALAKFQTGSGWEVGVDAAVTVIDTGGAGSFTVDDLKENPVVAFIFGQEGLMGGISLEGAKVSKIEGMDP